MKTYGLTGGVAAGKSEVARIFAQAGIPVLDADDIVHDLAEPGGAAYDLLIRRFGTAEREELGPLVFKDPQARRDLESILHPLVAAESKRRLAHFERMGARVAIYEAALLVETGRYRDFDGLIVVDAPREDRLERLMSRNRLSEDAATRIIDAQTSDQSRLAVATHVITNSGDLAQLRQKTLDLLKRL